MFSIDILLGPLRLAFLDSGYLFFLCCLFSLFFVATVPCLIGYVLRGKK